MTTYTQYLKMDTYLNKAAIKNRKLNKRAFAMYKGMK